MIKIRDFSAQKVFPGTTGNPFDIILHRFARVQRLPAFIILFLLVVLAVVASLVQWPRMLVLLAFFLSDWLLLALLPKFKISYGPPKPAVLLLVVARCLFGWLPWPVFWFFQSLGSLLVIIGFWFEPQRLVVTKQILITDKFPPGPALRILHLGDLHMERITRRERRLLASIPKLSPDLILFSGDVLSLSFLDDVTAIEDARMFLSQLQARCGSFAVVGSPAVDLDEVLPVLYEQTPVRLLTNEKVDLEIDGKQIELYGLLCSHKPFVDAPMLEELSPSHPEAFAILLYHSPDLAPNAALQGFDLHLAGHTHGGQVRLPVIGPLFTASLYGRIFQSGRYQLGEMVLYITRGIGMEGAGAPRVRLFCPPEIILWEITSSQNNTINELSGGRE